MEFENTQELSSEVSSQDPNAAPEGNGAIQALEVDGQRYTANEIKQMRQAQMRHDDYTKKTQTFQQERKQWETSAKALNQKANNGRSFLDNDLDAVRNGQASIADFKRVYHKDFHHYVDQLINEQRNKPNNQQGGIDPAFMNDVNQIKEQFHQMQVAAIDKELDVKEQEFTKKYPHADPSSVYMQADAMLEYKKNNGIKPEITNREWDVMWKSAHDKQSERFKQYQSALVNNQRQATAKNKGVGSGGGIPGQGPNKPRNIKEATDMLMSQKFDL